MALTNCPECEKEVSENAMACPHCGYPLQEEVGPQTAQPTISGMAIASLVCSIAGCFFNSLAGLILGIVLGDTAKRKIRESQMKIGGNGIATAGMIIGWIGITIYILIMALLSQNW